MFIEDALFKGLHSDPTRGTAAIIDYYAGQPRDLISRCSPAAATHPE